MCEAFMRVVELGIALKVKPLPEHDGCWEHQVDKKWFIAVNGHLDPQPIRKHPSGPPLQPYNVFVEYNGWPAGIFDPRGGCIAAGEGANEGTFIAALIAARSALQNEGGK
jgi:hypothetical protein